MREIRSGGISEPWSALQHVAIALFGFATIATGVVDIVWGAFDPAHQPIQAFGDHVPGRQAMAYGAGAILVAGGALVLRPRTARLGAMLSAAVYALFAIFWLPRFATVPPILGYSPRTYIAVSSGLATQLIAVCAALAICASTASPGPGRDRAMRALCWIFAVSTIDFGLQHLTGISDPSNVEMVPAWMPFGQALWVVVTGVAFVLAGISLLAGRLDVLAGRLLATMFFVFSALTLLPLLLADPHDQGTWGGNAYEFVAVASAWIFAEFAAVRHARPRANDRPPAFP